MSKPLLPPHLLASGLFDPGDYTCPVCLENYGDCPHERIHLERHFAKQPKLYNATELTNDVPIP